MKLAYDTDEGLGTRANLGVVVLETDETLEAEFAQMLRIAGVALYHTRIPMGRDIRPETLAGMEGDLPAAVRLLPPSLRFDVIGYGCTSAATVIGSDQVAAQINRVIPGARVTDPLRAIIAAGRALGAHRLGFITPYVPEVSLQMRGRLQAAGFQIAAFGSFEEGNDQVVARITEASIEQAVQQVQAQAVCDAMVIACTNLRCLHLIASLEAATGVPVISSNTALAWHMLRLAGVSASMPQFGQLFALGAGEAEGREVSFSG